MFSEDLALGAGEVILGQFTDRGEQRRPQSVIEIPGLKLFLRLRQPLAHILRERAGQRRLTECESFAGLNCNGALEHAPSLYPHGMSRGLQRIFRSIQPVAFDQHVVGVIRSDQEDAYTPFARTDVNSAATPTAFKGIGPSSLRHCHPRSAWVPAGTDISRQTMDSSSEVRVIDMKGPPAAQSGVLSVGCMRTMAKVSARSVKI